MNIEKINYNIEFQALEIYLSKSDKDIKLDKVYEQDIINKINTDDSIRRIWILGDEPLDNNHDELEDFLQTLKLFAVAERWIWTRYEYLPPRIEKLVHYAKFGAYKEELPGYVEDLFGIKLASNNQRIERIN